MSRRQAVAVGFALLWASWVVPAASAQTFRFPTSPSDYSEFYVTAYRDHAGGSALQDWSCGTDTYNGHGGTDYGVGGFPGMAAGRDVLAAADGTVVYVHDGEFDGCTSGSCGGGGGFGNYVKIEHPDGTSTYYGHLKQWSVAVSTGDIVTCGTLLGLVGSSGNSTGPHLHFEPRIGGSGQEPYAGPCGAAGSMWTVQGAYQGLPTMDCDGTPPPACTIGSGPGCGGVMSGTLAGGGGSSDAVSGYSCNAWSYAGPEYAFLLVAAATEPVTVSLTGLSADLDLLVLGGAGCDPTTCIASSDNPNSDDESVTFDAVAGSSYGIVVDGFEGAVSAFDIALSCPNTEPPPPPPPPPPGMLTPDLSVLMEIASIEDQDRDFVPTGSSDGIFDLYVGQALTVRIIVDNAPGAEGVAGDTVLGIDWGAPAVGLRAVDVYTNDPGAACGAEWCLEAELSPEAEALADEDGSTRVSIGEIAPGSAKMAVLVLVGVEPSSVDDHAAVAGYVSYVEGIYERAGLDVAPSYNEGQTWNGGDLSAVVEVDVWPWLESGSPPGAFADDPWPIVVNGGCGCRVVRAEEVDGRAGSWLALFLVIGLALVLRRR